MMYSNLLTYDVVKCGEEFNRLGAHVQKQKGFVIYVILLLSNSQPTFHIKKSVGPWMVIIIDLFAMSG